MVVPPKHPKMVILVGKPWLLGTTILGNPQIKRAYMLTKTCPSNTPSPHSPNSHGHWPHAEILWRRSLRIWPWRRKSLASTLADLAVEILAVVSYIYMSTLDECQVLLIQLGGRNWQNRFRAKMGSLFCELNSRQMGFWVSSPILSPKRTLHKGAFLSPLFETIIGGS